MIRLTNLHLPTLKIKLNFCVCALIWIYQDLFYGCPNTFGVNSVSVGKIGKKIEHYPKYYHENAIEKFPYSEIEYGNTSDLQIKWKKVRKKTGENLKSNLVSEGSAETGDTPTSLKLENAIRETLYMGYARNPFGSSTPWDQKHRWKNGKTSPEDEDNNTGEVRGKRGVTHLYNMVSCATGCNPLSYKGYGCYCGFLGSGQITDSIDRCCKMHDVCYTTVNCPVFFVYFMPYLWRCWRGRPQCAVDHLGFGQAGSCAARLCECDKELAMCLATRPCPRKRALCMSSIWRLFQNLIMY